MRQAQKSDLVLGNRVMVNYRNSGPCSICQHEFEGEFYTGFYTYRLIWHKKKIIDRILPIKTIKEIDPNGEKIWFGSGCDWQGLILLEPETNHDDYLAVKQWEKMNKLRDSLRQIYGVRNYSEEYIDKLISKRWYQYLKKEEYIRDMSSLH